MDSPANELAQLQQQMHQVRLELGEEMNEFVDNARAMTDWRVHWRRHPWAFGAAAALAGYLIVPSRRFGEIDARTLAQAAQTQVPPRSATSQLFSKLTGMALGLLAQRGAEIIGRQLEGFLASRGGQASDAGPQVDGESDQNDYE
jgi:hypothetical protein